MTTEMKNKRLHSNDEDDEEEEYREEDDDVESIEFLNEFTPLYFRTGTKNIRCFPICCDQHMERSFCGRKIEILLRTKHNPVQYQNGRIFAEFHPIEIQPSFNIGVAVQTDFFESIQDQKYHFGQFSHYDPRGLGIIYAIYPGRRWYYPTCDDAYEFHVLTVYVVLDSFVRYALSTPKFRIMKSTEKSKDLLSSSIDHNKQGGGNRDDDDKRDDDNNRSNFETKPPCLCSGECIC